MTLRINNNQRGIALGPILFIVAIIAILAAVISAGIGGFNSSTSTESAKAMAESLVTLCDDYQRAVQMMTIQNGCDPTALDWTPPSWPTGSTWNSGDFSTGGTNRAGNGQCAFFDPRGGGMVFKQVAVAALASKTTGAYTSGYTNDGGANEDAFAGYPFFMTSICINGLGTCPSGSSLANASLVMYVTYISYPVCQQINKTLSISLDPNSINASPPSQYLYGPFAGIRVRSGTDPGNYVAGGGLSGHAEACGYDWNSNGNNSAYVYYCAIMIR